MHPLFNKAAGLTQSIIGAAIEVHRDKGPGLVESIYEWCLQCELSLRGLPSVQQRLVRIRYKQFVKDEALRFDLLVDNCVLIEINPLRFGSLASVSSCEYSFRE